MRRPLLALALLFLVAECAGGCAQGPPPRAWAASVCSALAPWRAEIGTLTTRAQEQTPQSATPSQAKENLVRMLDGAHNASEKARTDVEAAGVPEAENGEAVAAAIVESLSKMRDAYGHARDAVQGLPTTDAASFYQAVADAMRTLQAEYSASVLDTTNLNSPELQQAFAEVPECMT